MFDILWQIIGYSQSGSYQTTGESTVLYLSCAVFIIVFVTLLDWTRNLFRSLFNRIK